MFDNFEKIITTAIRSELFLNITYRNKAGIIKEKKVAPYDLFIKNGRDFLLGCSKETMENMRGFSKYLEDIDGISIMSDHFSGEDVKRTLSYPSDNPVISRSW